MYSAIINGRVLDYQWVKLREGVYRFHIGDIYLGQLHNISNAWAAISGGYACEAKIHRDVFPVKGFKTRFDASEFLLKVYKINRGDSVC